MKKLNLIKSLLDYLLLMLYIVIPGGIMYLIFKLSEASEDYSIPFNGSDYLIPENSPLNTFVFGTKLLATAVLAYCLFHFRKMIITLQKRDFFSQTVYSNLRITGLTFILFSILDYVPTFGLHLFGWIKITNRSIIPSSFVIQLIIGLFLISISEIIQISGQIKEENDLTV
jgi:hypothetical protein